MEDREAILAKKGDYIAQLEEKLARSTSTSLRLEEQLQGLQVQLNLVEQRAMTVEKKATTTMMVMEVTKKEETESIRWYKALTEFEDEVWEVVCDPFVKDFEKCKRKMV